MIVREKQHEMIYSCEKRAFMKLESSFLQNYANFVHLCVEIMGSGLVVTEQASEEWKTGLLESCSELSKAVQLMRNEPTREEEPDLVSPMRVSVLGKEQPVEIGGKPNFVGVPLNISN